MWCNGVWYLDKCRRMGLWGDCIMGRYCDNRKALSSYLILMTHVVFLSCRSCGPVGLLMGSFWTLVPHRPLATSCLSMSHLTSVFLQVSAKDEDRGSFGDISYTLGSGSGGALPAYFTIDKKTGQLCTSTAVDRDEGLDKFDLTVTATDGVSRLGHNKQYGVIYSITFSFWWANEFLTFASIVRSRPYKL